MPVTEAAGLGQAFTAEEWSRFILDHLAAQSVVLASGATRIETDFKQVHVPRITGDGGANWYAELTPIGPGDPVAVELVLTPRKAAALTVLSNESVEDAGADTLDAVGNAMVRAVALKVDAGYFNGTGAANNQPAGLLTLGLPSTVGPVNYPTIVTASGKVREAGGTPDTLYIAPADLTALQLAVAADDRPLLSGDATAGAPPVVAGLRIFPTPALVAGSAIVAMASQIVVALRRDATVAVSQDAQFTSDGTVARVVMRTDLGVNDPAGLCEIKVAAVQAAKSKASS